MGLMDIEDTKAKLKFLALAALIVAVLLGMASPDSDLPLPPQALPPTGDCFADNIFYGAIPPGGEEGQVLVFVHGLSGLAEDWWSNNSSAGLNDMYLRAYYAGYRTAFVNLNIKLDQPADCSVKRRPANDMLDNGFVLSQQLNTIFQHYDVDQVDIVAHSKGGIDAQAAIVWEEAWQQVGHVFTLATPHQGSLLADLLWSPEGFWVSLLLGQRDEATFSMRTASMQLFRSITDPDPVDDAVRYYSGAGDSWQTRGTLFLLTGEWLQNHPDGGDNDGVVTVASTYLPYATTLFLEPWNHAQVYMGRNAFPYIHQVLLNDESIYLPLIIRDSLNTSSALQAFEAGRAGATSNATEGVSRPLESNYILRGGRLRGPGVEWIPIEPQARAVRFSLLTTHEAVSATLLGPNGARYPLSVLANEGHDIFGPASLLEHVVSQPSPGYWGVQIDSPTQAGYLLLVTLDSQLRIGLEGLPDRPIPPGGAVHLVARSQAPGRATQVDQIKLQAIRARPGSNRIVLEDLNPSADASLSHRFIQEDMYGVSITVYGQTDRGLPFERSFVGSLVVVGAETLASQAAILDKLSGR